MVSLRVGAGTVIAVGLLLGVVYLYHRRDLLDKINPTSDQNLAFQSANDLVGQERFANASDYLFGAIDLAREYSPILPAPNDTQRDYAKRIYRIGE